MKQLYPVLMAVTEIVVGLAGKSTGRRVASSGGARQREGQRGMRRGEASQLPLHALSLPRAPPTTTLHFSCNNNDNN